MKQKKLIMKATLSTTSTLKCVHIITFRLITLVMFYPASLVGHNLLSVFICYILVICCLVEKLHDP